MLLSARGNFPLSLLVIRSSAPRSGGWPPMSTRRRMKASTPLSLGGFGTSWSASQKSRGCQPYPYLTPRAIQPSIHECTTSPCFSTITTSGVSCFASPQAVLVCRLEVPVTHYVFTSHSLCIHLSLTIYSGFKGLKPLFAITIVQFDGNKALPTAATCFNHLKLPRFALRSHFMHPSH